MVSTYLGYDIVARNFKQALTRVAKQTDVSRAASYYKDNIGKVKTVDDFLKNDRLYQYAMKAYGLEDMTYAKAFMRQVLNSDLTDSKSFANKLTDKRYRDFAAAFSFSNGSSAIAQSSYQTDEMVGLYTKTAQRADDAVTADSRYYNAKMGSIRNVDDLLNDDRLRSYAFTAFGVDDSHLSRDTLKQILCSDPSDPSSTINTVWGTRLDDFIAKYNQAQSDATDANSQIATFKSQLSNPGADVADLNAKIATQQARLNTASSDMSNYSGWIKTIGGYFDLASAYEFQPDGTVAAGDVAQVADNRTATNERYVAAQPRKSTFGALLESDYFKQKIATVTKVDDLFSDADGGYRMQAYLGTAFGVGTLSLATLKSILTSDRDPNNASSFVNQAGTDKAAYTAMLNAFNFNTDGTLSAGVDAQTASQTATTVSKYSSTYNDADEQRDTLAVKSFKTAVATVSSVDKFLSTAAVYNFALNAVGLDPASESSRTIKAVLESDLSDPSSFVYKLKDDRYLQLARDFNFDSKGKPTTPMAAQDDAEVSQMAKDYVLAKTKYASTTEQAKLQAAAEDDAVYYKTTIAGIDNVSELLADKKLVNFILVAKGLDPKTVTTDTLKKVFASDLNDPKSFANTASDSRFAEIAAAFNFDTKGNVTRIGPTGPQDREQLVKTQNNYLQVSLETQQGDANPGVRLALYFQRKAPGITNAYDILADKALFEVFRTTYDLPDSMANAKIEDQAKIVTKYLKLSDLGDPTKLGKILSRFATMYDLKNGTQDSSSPLLALFGNSSSGSYMGQDMLTAIAQIKRR